jgi:hypothetical protein
MKLSHHRAISLAVFVSLLSIIGCGRDDPFRLPRPPVVKSMFPQVSSLDALVGFDTLSFSISAVDPDKHPLKYCYSLEDSIVSNTPTWVYAVEDTGTAYVRCLISNGVSSAEVRWTLRRIKPENQPPAIDTYRPPVDHIFMIVGDAQEFFVQASDPENRPLSYFYTVNDTPASNSQRLNYMATYVGSMGVKVSVSDGESFARQEWNITVAAEPDSIAPAAVMLISAGKGTDPGELLVRWTAVGDDDMDGRASNYILRTSTDPIVDEFSWERASDKPGEPPAAEAGQVQEMMVRGLHPADSVFVAVRAQDDFGNLSPLGNTLGGITKGLEVYGTIRDAVTQAPLPGIMVTIGRHTEATRADGSYALTELPAVISDVAVRDEDIPGVYGSYFDIIRPGYRVAHRDTLDYWMLPNLALETTEYPDFLSFFKEMTRSDDNCYGNRCLLRTWRTPCKVHIPALINKGINYRQVVWKALQDWNDSLGVTIFEWADAKPDTGVYIVFDSTASEKYEVENFDPQWFSIQGRITLKSNYELQLQALLEKTARHEVGHALGMDHSSDEGHLMVGGRVPAVPGPTPDEVSLGKAMYGIPRGQLMDMYKLD